MALPSGTFTTYSAIGQREDLEDRIYNIAPTDTPGLSSFARVDASAVLHEWQTDTLASAAANAVLEGDDATTDSATATTRLSNTCQISDKVPRVTGTMEAVSKAGRKSELAYQVAIRAKELKRDMENDIFANVAENTGSATVARTYGAMPSWITTNTSNGTSGTDGSAGNTARTDGTQRPFTETLLKAVLQDIWTAGGDPDVIMLGAFNKRALSAFSGNATREINATEKRLVTSIEVYESDWGVIKVVPNRFSRSRDALILELKFWALAYLRPFRLYDLAKTGDSERKQLLVEWTLVSRNEKASGGVFDLTTS